MSLILFLPRIGITLFWLIAAIAALIAPAFLITLLFSVALYSFLLKRSALKDRKFISFMVGIGVGTRVFFLVLLQHFLVLKGKLDIFGDAQDNINQGLSVYHYLIGQASTQITFSTIFLDRYNTHGKTFFNALYFAVMGTDIFALKYINIAAVALTAWLAYDILRRVYSAFAGKIAMALILFWPTLFVWSITDLKESHLVCMIVGAFWSFVRLSEAGSIKKKAVFFLLLCFTLGYAVTLKFRLLSDIFLGVFFASAAYYAVSSLYRKNRVQGKLFLLLGSVILLMCAVLFREYIVHTSIALFSKILSYHKGFLSSGGWNYDLLGQGTENFYSLDFFTGYLLRAWFHFFLEPFPWRLSSISMFCMMPVMLVWYLLLVFSAFGVLKCYAIGKLRSVMPALIFIIFYVSVVGMVVANIGTAVRFRDAIMPFIVMLAAAGFTSPDKGKAR